MKLDADTVVESVDEIESGTCEVLSPSEKFHVNLKILQIIQIITVHGTPDFRKYMAELDIIEKNVRRQECCWRQDNSHQSMNLV